MIYTVTLNPSIDYVVHVDSVELGEINRMKQDFKLPGGKGINVSRILNRLNVPTTALGFLGGFTGNFIGEWLEAEGIHNQCTNIESDTRINIKLKAQEETEINGLGPVLKQTEINELKAALNQVNPGDIVVLSGSTPPSLPKNFYGELIKIIKNKQAEFVIDTTGPDLLEAISQQPLLIKPNNHELEELFETSFTSIEDIFPYGQKLLDSGAQHVLVSLAGDGALLFTHEGLYRSNVPDGTVKNSVGAGDSMIAGFVGTFAQTNDYLEAFKYGLAAGSATAFANDLATGEEIQALLPEIVINKLTM